MPRFNHSLQNGTATDSTLYEYRVTRQPSFLLLIVPSLRVAFVHLSRIYHLVRAQITKRRVGKIQIVGPVSMLHVCVRMDGMDLIAALLFVRGKA